MKYSNKKDVVCVVRGNIQHYMRAKYGKNQELDMVYMLYNFDDIKYIKTENEDIDANELADEISSELGIQIVPLYKKWIDYSMILFAPITRTVNQKIYDITIIDDIDHNKVVQFRNDVPKYILELEWL